MSSLLIGGLVGLGIDTAIKEILSQISVVVRFSKELESLNELLISLQVINFDLHSQRFALSSDKFGEELIPSVVDNWLQKLDELLQQATEIVQECTIAIPTYDVFSRYKKSKKISRTVSNIKEHRDNAALIGITTQLGQLKRHLQYSSREILTPTSSVAPMRESMKFTGELLIVGQDMAFTRLEELVQNESRMGVVGMGGLGKTLLLKRLFNSNQVQNLFGSGLLLWLTVSQIPFFSVLRNDLGNQIAFQTNEDFNHQLWSEDDIKVWLNRRLRKHKFALFLDDVWDRGAHLLEELGVPLPSSCMSNNDSSVIIASSRNNRALLEMGVPASSTVQLQELMKNDSWQLFLSHAFPHNSGKLPTGIQEEIARSVCKECQGLPLAIKIIGRAMAGITHSEEWEVILKRLQNAEAIKQVTEPLHSRLRLSYDALAEIDISLQRCFLCLALFTEDQILYTPRVSMLWIGEGLVTGHNPLKIASTYVNILVDRCLVEAVWKDIDGSVVCFRLHDVLHDLARQISGREGNYLFQAGRGLEQFPANDCSRCIRMSLMENRLTSVADAFRGPRLRSLLLRENPYLIEIPKHVMRSMSSLRVLDLPQTSILSLPETLGCLKHLVCLNLQNTPIKRLPNSITALKNLQILNLGGSGIRELPSKIDKLSSLRILDIVNCKYLQSIPYRISKLTSLEYFGAVGAANAWIRFSPNKIRRNSPSINDLGNLIQLKRLKLENGEETIREGTLARIKQIESLYLSLAKMESLPHDIIALSKLRKVWLRCPQLSKVEITFSRFQFLNYINLSHCNMLTQLPDLHKIASLTQLHIVACCNLEILPKEFGERGAFPKLEVFSLIQLHKLQELPAVEEGAMPSLTTFILMQCKALKVLPESYWNLQRLQKIRVYGCSMVQQNLIETNTKVQIVTMSTSDTEALLLRWEQMFKRRECKQHGEFWTSDVFEFLYETLHVLAY